MHGMLEFLISVAAAYGLALAAWPALRTRRGAGLALSCCVGVAVLCCPLLIPADKVVHRAFASLACVELTFKMLGYARHARCRERGTSLLGKYGRFLIPFPLLLVVLRRRGRRLPKDRPRRREAARVIVGAGLFAAGFVLVDIAARIPAVRSSFPLDHTVKIAIFIVTVEGLSSALYGLERLAGCDTTPLIRRAFLAKTVAEFWYRYNTRIHAWFYENVFRPAGGRRTPVRAALITFFVSAVLHELTFAVTTSRIDGYQFAFFMLQAPAALVSGPLRRFGRRGGIAGEAAVRCLTIGWMLVTSVLFFHGVNRVFPFFYASRPWLP